MREITLNQKNFIFRNPGIRHNKIQIFLFFGYIVDVKRPISRYMTKNRGLNKINLYFEIIKVID